MGDLKEQRECIRLCSHPGKSETETFDILKVAFGEQARGTKKFLPGFLSSEMA
jgi:hypothetical protein